ncbi:MAG: LysR family transcriptional regulator [Rhodospirillales bacterium]|nr:LysR family transcriptional regulator [Rhodospirillales bacterium]
MKDSLKAGISITKTIEIDRGRTVGFMGDEGRVYSTPSMVADIEYACRNFLLDHLDPGEDTVGTHISVDHMAPTVEGDKVTIEIEIAHIDRRAVTMEIKVSDTLEQVGRGTHTRFVADVSKTHERLAAKREKMKGG